MKISKKIFSILCILFLFCGCINKSEKEIVVKDSGEKYLELLKNYKVSEKNSNNTVDNEDFNVF